MPPFATFVPGAGSGASQVGNTVALLGDSITNQNVDITSAPPSKWYSGIGYFTVANVRLRHRLRPVLDTDGTTFGASSQGAAEVIANGELAKAVAADAAWAIVALGTIDIGNSRTYAQITADLATIHTALLASGKRVVACTILPRGDVLDATRHQRIRDVNRWIRTQCQSTPGMVLCDWYPYIVQASDGKADLSFLYDTVHPDGRGALIMGKVLADVLDPLVPKVGQLGNAADTTNLLTNPLLTGDTSGVATSWTQNVGAGVTRTASKVARTDGIAGEWQQFAVTANTGTGTMQFIQNVTAGFTAGQSIIATIEFELDSGMTFKAQPQLQITATGGETVFVTDNRLSTGDQTSMSTYGERLPAGVLRTPAMTIPTGTTNIAFRADVGNGIGTVRWGRAELSVV